VTPGVFPPQTGKKRRRWRWLWFSGGALILAGLILFPGAPLFAPVRQALIALVAETSGPVAQAVSAVRARWSAITEAAHLQERALRLELENEALRAELEQTKQELEKARYLAETTRSGTELPAGARAALVIWRLPGYPALRYLVDAGSAQGVAKGAGVISEGRVAGIVHSVSSRRALVLSPLDPSFRAAGKLEGSGTVGLAQGQTDRLVVRYIPSETLVQPGERVLTSGDDGIFPPGFILGYVRSRETGGQSYHTLTLEPAFPTLGLRLVIILPRAPDDPPPR
jgi:rod shape-determining protein MreC